MTWTKASPTLIVAGIFDLARIFFEMFWFFGPAIVGLYCDEKVGGVAVVGKALSAACAAGATTIGVAGAPAIEAFGAIMAIAVGFFGWLAVGWFILLTRNQRIFKSNAVNIAWFAGSLLISEIPFVGTLPALSGAMWKLHSAQIKKEKAALAAYEKAHAEEELERRRQQEALLMQQQAGQVAEAEQEAANDAVYEEAANDAQYAAEEEGREIPEEERRAA
jgi:hypothetical protein